MSSLVIGFHLIDFLDKISQDGAAWTLKVLVTGGSGFIGTNFTMLLIRDESVQIANLDKLSYGSNHGVTMALRRNPRYRFVHDDITNQRVMLKFVEWADVVVNFAAESHVDRSISDPSRFLHTNTFGVHSILEAIRKAKRDVKLVQIGTDEEYGEIEHGSFREGDALAPSSPYASSKAAASMLINAYFRTYGLKTIITRCTNNFGPYQSPEKLIPKTVIRAILGMNIPVYGSGTNVRDWIYVDDHCEAIVGVLRGGRPGEVYNISSGNELQNSSVVSAIMGILDKPMSLVGYVEDRPGHDRRYSLDSSKIRNQIGWKPRHTFHEGLEKTVEWYVKNEKWWRPLAHERVLHPTPWKLRW